MSVGSPEWAREVGRIRWDRHSRRATAPAPEVWQATRPDPRGHAIVIGASLAGLLAARVLSETYASVTLLDRDIWADNTRPRGGVPQGAHAHGLLARGRDVLEELFPGLTDELVRSGAFAGDLQQQCRWYFGGSALAAGESGLQGLAVSRPALEQAVRRRVGALPGVRIQTGVAVRGLAVDPTARQVTGVITSSVATDGPPVRRTADLVIDASGRNSRAPVWLDELGYESPHLEQVRVDVCYATRHFRRTPGSASDAFAVVVAASPDSAWGGALIRQEGERWILTLGGYHGDRPPLDLDGFRACAAEMVPEFAEVAGTAEPLDDGKYFRFPASNRRRYERLQRFPERFVVMGDAVCSFNPVYGQGITVSAVEALALRRCLDDGSKRLGIRFFDEIKPVVDVPWQIAAGADLELPDTPGRPPLPTRLINRYIARLQLAAGHDAELAGAFLRVANLMAPPPSLMRPDRMLRVLLKGRRRRQPVSDPAPGAIAATRATAQTWDVEPSGR